MFLLTNIFKRWNSGVIDAVLSWYHVTVIKDHLFTLTKIQKSVTLGFINTYDIKLDRQ